MPEPNVGLYLRLSRDDEGSPGESMSIANQRAFLTDYARERNWTVKEVYADDSDKIGLNQKTSN